MGRDVGMAERRSREAGGRWARTSMAGGPGVRRPGVGTSARKSPGWRRPSRPPMDPTTAPGASTVAIATESRGGDRRPGLLGLGSSDRLDQVCIDRLVLVVASCVVLAGRLPLLSLCIRRAGRCRMAVACVAQMWPEGARWSRENDDHC